MWAETSQSLLALAGETRGSGRRLGGRGPDHWRHDLRKTLARPTPGKLLTGGGADVDLGGLQKAVVCFILVEEDQAVQEHACH